MYKRCNTKKYIIKYSLKNVSFLLLVFLCAQRFQTCLSGLLCFSLITILLLFKRQFLFKEILYFKKIYVFYQILINVTNFLILKIFKKSKF